MSHQLYRRTENGIEPFSPDTTAERVAYGAGTVADALAGLESGDAVTGVKGAGETAYRTGKVSLSAQDVGAAEAGHGHAEATESAAGFISASDKVRLNRSEPVLLWSGSWKSGSITSSGFGKYRLFLFYMEASRIAIDYEYGVLAAKNPYSSYIMGDITNYGGSSALVWRVCVSCSGNTLTFGYSKHSNGNNPRAIARIYGVM